MSRPEPARPATRRQLAAIAAAYGALWLVLAIDPVYRVDWLLENLLVVAATVFLAVTHRWLRLSLPAYLMIASFLALHALGAHYTYSEAPPGFWLQAALGLERNHFDRLVHFAFGLLLAYPLLEVGERRGQLRGAWAYGAVFAAVVAASTIYELLEWIIASLVEPEAALAWLGTQGDPFDAQKDTGLATLGAALTLSWVALRRRAS